MIRSDDFLLQMEVSAIIERGFIDVTAEVEVETTTHPLMTPNPQEKNKTKKLARHYL